MTYFDNAATTFPKPVGVKNAVDRAITCYGANPGRGGHDLSVETAKRVYEVRVKVAEFFGAADESHVVFTSNCTWALNTAIKGLLRPGNHVIISDLEHNSVLRPVHALAARGVITYSTAATSLDDARTVDAFRRLIRPNTRAIITTHGSNVFGIKLPVARLAALAREYGLYFIVDAAQTAGTEELDVAGMGIDCLCMAGHKGLYGPSGTGLLITKLGPKLTPLAEGGTGSASADYAQPDFMPDRLEPGTINTMGILGLGAGIDFVKGHGISKIGRYESRLMKCIYDEIAQEKNVLLYTPAPQHGVNLPVLSFNIRGMTSEEVTAQLNEAGFALRGGLHCAPIAHKKYGTLAIGGTARISAGAFNTAEQAHALAKEICRIACGCKKRLISEQDVIK